MNTYVQTGDVIFYPLGFDGCIDPIAKEIPANAIKRKNLVVQEGRTGNTHALRGEDAEIFDCNGRVFVNVKTEAFAIHGEHAERRLWASRYEVRNVQEENVFTGMRAAVVD